MPDPTLDLRWPLEETTTPEGAVVLRTVEQDTPEDIRRGLALVCALRPGDLPWDPDLGIPDPLGSTDPDEAAALIASELRAIDPRPASIEVRVDDADDGGRNLHLTIETT